MTGYAGAPTNNSFRTHPRPFSLLFMLLVLLPTTLSAQELPVLHIACDLGAALNQHYELGHADNVSQEVADEMCRLLTRHFRPPSMPHSQVTVVPNRHIRAMTDTSLGEANCEGECDLLISFKQTELYYEPRTIVVSFNHENLQSISTRWLDAGDPTTPPDHSRAPQYFATAVIDRLFPEKGDDLRHSLTRWPVACGGEVVHGSDGPMALFEHLTWDAYSHFQHSVFTVEMAVWDRTCVPATSVSLSSQMVSTSPMRPHSHYTLTGDDGEEAILGLAMPADVAAPQPLSRVFFTCNPAETEGPMPMGAELNSRAILEAIAGPNAGLIYSLLDRVCPSHKDAVIETLTVLRQQTDPDAYTTVLAGFVIAFSDAGMVGRAEPLLREAFRKAADDPHVANSPALSISLLVFFAHADVDPQEYAQTWQPDVEAAFQEATDDVLARVGWLSGLYGDPAFDIAPAGSPFEEDFHALAVEAIQASGRAFLEAGDLTAARVRFAAAWMESPSSRTATDLLFLTRMDPPSLDPEGQTTAEVVRQIERSLTQGLSDAETARGTTFLAASIYESLGVYPEAMRSIARALHYDREIVEATGQPESSSILRRYLGSMLWRLSDVEEVPHAFKVPQDIGELSSSSSQYGSGILNTLYLMNAWRIGMAPSNALRRKYVTRAGTLFADIIVGQGAEVVPILQSVQEQIEIIGHTYDLSTAEDFDAWWWAGAADVYGEHIGDVLRDATIWGQWSRGLTGGLPLGSVLDQGPDAGWGSW